MSLNSELELAGEPIPRSSCYIFFINGVGCTKKSCRKDTTEYLLKFTFNLENTVRENSKFFFFSFGRHSP
jgi:hypothetical protein